MFVDRSMVIKKHSCRTGTGEAGKSTFIKQMRIIHGAGYTDKDRAEFRQLIFQNVLRAVQILSDAMEALKINYTDDSNRVSSFYNGCVNMCV